MKFKAISIHYYWNNNRMTCALGFALLPIIIIAIFQRSPSIAATLLLALGVGIAWPLLFAKLRHQPMRWDGLLTAIIFVLFLPATTPIWQISLSLSFGLVFGDLIFGERGRSFLNPVTVGLAFLLFSFPNIVQDSNSVYETFAAFISGICLLGLGLLSWRIITAFIFCLGALLFLLDGIEGITTMPSTILVLGLVFLIGDPVAAACTNTGRWIYGGLAAGLVVLLGQSGSGIGSLSSVVFAAILASIFAPAIDQIIIQLNIRRRARRQVNV